MCGIWGVVLNNKQHTYRSQAIEEFLGEAAVVGSLRGMDATGVMRVNSSELTKPAWVYKKAVAGADFIQMKNTARILQTVGSAAFIIGHNRKGTSGRPSRDANAHPFQSGDITLVHNGHISNAHSLGGDRHDVDSAVVCSAFAEKGAAETLPKLRGAYCLVWHDAKDGTLNIARNMDRPLHWIALGEGPDKFDGWLMASEMEMLWWLVERNKLPHHGQFLYPDEHVWYKFNHDNVFKYTATHYTPEKEVAYSPGNFTRDQNGRWVSRDTGFRTATPEGTAGLSRSDRRLAQRLSSLGFRLNEQISIVPKVFIPYKNQRDRGCLKGVYEAWHSSRRGDAIDVFIDNVTSYEAEAKIANKITIGGSVIGIRDGVSLVASMNRYNTYDHHTESTPITMTVMGPNRKLVTRARFKELTKDGCAVCSKDLFEYEAPHIEWRPGTPDSPVCGVCQNQAKMDGHGVMKFLPGLH